MTSINKLMSTDQAKRNAAGGIKRYNLSTSLLGGRVEGNILVQVDDDKKIAEYKDSDGEAFVVVRGSDFPNPSNLKHTLDYLLSNKRYAGWFSYHVNYVGEPIVKDSFMHQEFLRQRSLVIYRGYAMLTNNDIVQKMVGDSPWLS